jgi:hypothetical protein
MKSKITLLISFLLILSACGKSTVIPTQPSLTTAIPLAMPTLTPTATSIPLPTLSSTPAPTKTLEPFFVTQEALHNKFGKYCERGNSNRIALSPNGQWAGLECNYGIIKIVHIDEKKEWEMPYESLFGPYYSAALFIEFAHWSIDGMYAYVSANPHTDGYWEPFHQAYVLYRFNLGTGQISEVLPVGKNDRIYYSFAFAPDDSILAYIETDKSPVTLTLHNRQTNTEQLIEFDPKYNTGGGFVWSPDSQKLVFSITQFDLSTHEYVATSIVLWDILESDPVVLIGNFQDFIEPIEWVEENKVVLQGWTLENEQLVTLEFELDLTSGELIQIIP